MTRKPIRNEEEKGMVLVVVAGLLIVLLLFAGLAIDVGRAYLVKAQMTKAVDGAALAAARALGSTASGNPERDEAVRIFLANFPSGYLGVSSVTDPLTAPNFFSKVYDAASGSNIITIQATATLPMTFMRLGNFDQLTVGSGGVAKRRLVDLSLAIDGSSSIGSDWSTVRDAARRFINSFDAGYDRIAVTGFSDGATVTYQMPSARGFNKTAAMNPGVPTSLPGGSTSMADGLYRAWDELRAVPLNTQAGLRVIVLFTDGTPNGLPGTFIWSNGSPYSGKSLNTNDFPPDSGVAFFGLSNADCPGGPHCFFYPYNPPLPAGVIGTNGSVAMSYTSHSALPNVPCLPATSTHAYSRSSGIPTSFPLQVSTLTVNGVAQSTRRGLRDLGSGGCGANYPTQIWNTNNAARNLVEIIANAARSENMPVPANPPPYPIRIYTIGMGDILNSSLGTIPETSASILKRVANDPAQAPADHNPNQMDGKYYWAQTAADVDAVFVALRSEIIRLSQ